MHQPSRQPAAHLHRPIALLLPTQASHTSSLCRAERDQGLFVLWLGNGAPPSPPFPIPSQSAHLVRIARAESHGSMTPPYCNVKADNVQTASKIMAESVFCQALHGVTPLPFLTSLPHPC
jgi:hypothetical protein